MQVELRWGHKAEMLLIFKPEVYEKIKLDLNIEEIFPDEPIMAYMYVSAPIGNQVLLTSVGEALKTITIPLKLMITM
ncbi:MAG: hypothetical protein V8T24_11390 [Roseburia hominis]